MKDKIISGVIGALVGGLIVFGYGSLMNDKQANDTGENTRGPGRATFNTEGNGQQRGGDATGTRTNLGGKTSIGEVSTGETGSGKISTERTSTGKTIREGSLDTMKK